MTGIQNTSQGVRRSVALALTSLPLLLVSGCLTTSTYERMLADVDNASTANVWADDAAVAAASGAHTLTSHDPSAVRQKIAATRKRWASALDRTDGTTPPFVPADLKPYLVSENELDTMLAKPVGLTTLTGVLVVRNPTVRASATSARAAVERYSQAENLDDILSQYNAFTKQLNTRVPVQKQKKMNAMSFPYPDTLALKSKVIDEDVALAMDAHEIAIRDAVTDLREAYYGRLFVDQALAINSESQELLEQMIGVAQAKIRTGNAKYNAVIMAQVELSKLSDMIITLEEERETLTARINSLLNRMPEAPLGDLTAVKETRLKTGLPELYAMVIEHRQELRQQRRRISRMKSMIALATRMAYPDATLGASYFEDRMRLSSGTGVAPPAFPTQREANHTQAAGFGQRDAYIREVRTRIGAMENMLTAMEDKARFAAKKRHFGLQTAQRSIELYTDSLLPQSQQAVDATAASYRAGKSDFLVFLDAERTRLKFRLEEQRARRDYRTHLARLEQLLGKSLATGDEK
jgi:hypothetical protein